MPNGYVIIQPYVQIFKCYFISGPVKSLLRDPSLEENTSFFLKWLCFYLGVYLLQPGYILSANRASHERTYAPLYLIHSDIAITFPHMSMIQSKYALTFIDEFSRCCWVYFLKHKFEVFDLFNVFRALVENHFGRKLKILRYDNGGEYVKSEFIHYCKYAAFDPLHTTTKWCC